MFSFSRIPLAVALIAIAIALPLYLDLLPAGSEPPPGTQRSPDTDTFTDTDTDRMAARAAPLVFPALSRHTATVIFVHGLGDSGRGWADAVQLWQRKHRLDEVKFVLPNARVMPVTVVSSRFCAETPNQGYPMPAWFDIKSLGASPDKTLDETSRDTDEPGILESRAYLYALIQQEVSGGISSDRIVLGGFSQGGAVSLFSGLTAPFRLAGIVGLSCWLPLSHKLKESIPEASPNQETPIFMGHGDADQTVLYEWGAATEKRLKDLGYDVTLETYGGIQHSACMEEFDDVESFLVSRLPAKGSTQV
ncbi:hypothetical protein Trco_007443 [Trichoderma cornu-damae]|uniref:Acyl-protein thioesterase 1 n=1 Tax=Trichoderma cornu-damae TaxID=654480 RepID=A0A9P8TTF4_9HYPO|nr:hypothetical protein Trco_007443 [Trichoderma cornu-damae]